ncbi:MAG: mechanosensitive ion channel protein MscS [Pseudomonadota bacterium]
MKRHNTYLISALMGLSLMTSMAHAGEGIRHSGQSLEHSAQAAGHLSVGTVKTASGVIAIPLKATGKVGELSGQAGDDLWDYANEPFEVGDEVITKTPTPDQMI